MTFSPWNQYKGFFSLPTILSISFAKYETENWNTVKDTYSKVLRANKQGMTLPYHNLHRRNKTTPTFILEMTLHLPQSSQEKRHTSWLMCGWMLVMCSISCSCVSKYRPHSLQITWTQPWMSWLWRYIDQMDMKRRSQFGQGILPSLVWWR